MTLADRIVVMRGGHIEQVGTPLEVYHNPITRFVADFFGSPPMNLLDGEIRRENGVFSFEAGRFRATLRAPLHNLEGEATLGIRPEHISVADGDIQEGADLSVTVALVVPLGKDTLLCLDYGNESNLIAVIEGHREIKTDSRVGVRFQHDRLYFFGPDGGRLKPTGSPS